MSRLIIATGNQGKVREIKKILEGVYDEILSLKDIGLNVEVVEDGETFYENAKKKAEEISKLVEGDVLADDSGLMVDALGDAPGVYSARYAGEPCDDEKNNQKLICEVSKLPEDQRDAKFVCALVLARNGREILNTYGEAKGQIILEPQGENGFGYDPLFFVHQLNQTFAQIPSDLKNEISHRALALKSLEEKLAAK